MKVFRITGFLAALALIGYHLINIDYEDLRFHINQFHYMGIVAATLIALSLLLGIIKDRRQKP